MLVTLWSSVVQIAVASAVAMCGVWVCVEKLNVIPKTERFWLVLVDDQIVPLQINWGASRREKQAANCDLETRGRGGVRSDGSCSQCC